LSTISPFSRSPSRFNSANFFKYFSNIPLCYLFTCCCLAVRYSSSRSITDVLNDTVHVVLVCPLQKGQHSEP
jgi:hypothetical protein